MSLATLLSTAIVATVSITAPASELRQPMVVTIQLAENECTEEATPTPRKAPEVFQRQDLPEPAIEDDDASSFCGATSGPFGDEATCQFELLA